MWSIAGVRGRSWAVAILGKGLRRPGLGWSVWEGFLEEVTVGWSGREDSICKGPKVREGFWVCAGRSQRPHPRSGGSWAPCVREPTGPVGVQGSGFPGFALGVARQSRAASGCPSSWPRWSAGPGRALHPARDRPFPGRAWPGLGSPGDGSGHLGSVGMSERGLCVKAGRTRGRRARSLAVGHGELRKGGSQDGWKVEVQRAPPRALPRPRLPLARATAEGPVQFWGCRLSTPGCRRSVGPGPGGDRVCGQRVRAWAEAG